MKFTAGALTLQRLEEVYFYNSICELDHGCRAKVEKAYDIVAKAAAGERGVYGVNTGFGKLANTRIAAAQTMTLQRNLILSHCSGMGEFLSQEVVRLVMLLKLNSLAQGASGVSWKLIQLLQAMFEKGVYPCIPAKGSVGASGDLAPLAHMTVAMIGEGMVFFEDEKMHVNEAFKRLSLSPIVLGPKEGLAMINGTQVCTALALAGLFDAWRSCQFALVSGALASDAVMASTAPFRAPIHELRRQRGQYDAATCLRSLLHGSALRESHREDDERVQDPYCVRCQPQVMGACIDIFRSVANTLENEANAVTDNPLVIVETGEILSGGNFHAEPVAFAADQCALAISEIGAITQRRIAMLVDPALNYGLPAFLSPRPGLNSGFMVAEVTAAALMSENKQKASPCSVDSTPTSANQEDHVSMACHAAYRLIEMNKNLASIIAIELLAACQGVEFREEATSKILEQVKLFVRKQVPTLEDDRMMSFDLEKMLLLLTSGTLTNSAGKENLPNLYAVQDT